MSLLSDGSVIPSFLSIAQGEGKSGREYSLSDTSLRVGEIVAAHNPNTSKSTSKKKMEYDVKVMYGNGEGAISTIVYRNVQLANLFGGVADFFNWTPRIENLDLKTGIGLGSRVLILCINGNSRNAYIIGGVPHPDDKKQQKKEDGHNLEFEFNGLNAKVNKDGDLIVTHKSATNADGSIKDSSKSGAFFSFTKDGKINLSAKANIYNETPDKFEIKTTNGVKINPGGIMSQAFVRGTIYRQQEDIMHQTIKPLLLTITTLLTAASTQIIATGGLVAAAGVTVTAAGGTLSTAGGLHKIPVVGPKIAAPIVQATGASLNATGTTLTSAGTTLTSAGSTLASLAPLFTQIQIAIQLFDSLSSEYLSKKHEFAESPLG